MSTPASEATTSSRFYSPIIWLSLLCLDAPLVAVAWQWLFARSFAVRIPLALRVILFLTAWLIYMADRFADTLKLPAGAPVSLRHQFCKTHMPIWWATVVVIFVLDASFAVRSLDLQVLILGGTVAFFSAAYLVLNHSLGGRWRPFPIKEKAIGVLFAAGTTLAVVTQLPVLTLCFALAVVLFAILCSFNCLCIASWERDLDLAQGKATLLTRWPVVGRVLRPFGFALALVACAAALRCRGAWPLWLCLATSALLLVRLHSARTGRALDQRTALADLVLLTPLFVAAWTFAR